jgi:hypothetical protein
MQNESDGFVAYDPWLEDSPHNHVLTDLTVDLPLVQSVVAGMLAAPFDAHVQYRGCRTLGIFAYHYKGNSHVRCAGGVEAVLNAMRTCLRNESVQMEALKMFVKLAGSADGNGKEDLACRMMNFEDDVGNILFAMRMYPKHVAIQLNGVKLIKVFSLLLDTEHAFINAGPIDVVLRALKTASERGSGGVAWCSRDRHKIRSVCMHMLSHWTVKGSPVLMEGSPATLESLWKNGAVALVVRLMLATKSNQSEILGNGVNILYMLAQHDPAITEDVALRGGVEAVIHAWKADAYSPFSLELTLELLATSEVGVGEIVAIGGVKILVDRMRTFKAMYFMYSQAALFHSCAILAVIASTQRGMDVVVEEGGIEVTLDMIRLILNRDEDVPHDYPPWYILRERLLRDASLMLEKFIEHEEATRRIIDHGGVSILQDVLNVSHGGEELMFSVTKVLRGVHDTRALIREKNMSFAKGMHREQALNSSLKPDLVKKILKYAYPRAGVRTAVGAGPPP